MFRNFISYGLYVAIFSMLVFSAATQPGWTQTSEVKSEADPFKTLKGRWGGSGMMKLTRNRRARLACTATYSGSSSQLRLAINCIGNAGAIKMNARLSRHRNRLTGVWEEDTFGALGTIAGKIKGNKLQFVIGGNVFGRMSVSYTRSRQVIKITARGIPMQEANMNLTRR